MSTATQDGFRRLWLAGSSDAVRIPYATFKEANNFRLRLYAFAKKFRLKPELDPELAAAIWRTEVCVRKDCESFILMVRPDWMNEQMAHALASLGVVARPELAAQSSEAEFVKRMAQEGLIEQGQDLGLGMYDDPEVE